MEVQPDKNGDASLNKSKSSDSASSVTRRSSNFGPTWFKKLSSRVSGTDPETGLPVRRRGSVSSIFSNKSQDSDSDADDLGRSARTKSGTPARRLSAVQFSQRPVRCDMEPGAQFPASNLTMRLRSSIKVKNDDKLSGKNTVIADSAKACSKAGELDPKESEINDADSKQSRCTLKELEARKINTRAVGFALSTFVDNPPQRIPPITPVKGSFDFLENGELIVHKRLRHGAAGEPSYMRRDHMEVCKLAQAKARQSAERLCTSINSGTLAGIFSGNKQTSENLKDEEPTNASLAQNDIDLISPKSAHIRDNLAKGSGYISGSPKSNKLADKRRRRSLEDDGWESFSPQKAPTVPPPEQVYIRCCHLREIMPIKNILKQLKGQLAPIPQVRVANIKPTLVEIQAFSDFLTVVPVASLNLDNHIMTDEMIKLILAGISRSRDIARLTFVNTKFSSLGWQYLCSFLSNSLKSIAALTLTCTNPTGAPHRVPSFTRRDMDWALFSEALAAMGSLEELNLEGTEITINDLKLLLDGGFKDGKILSLANNRLDNNDVRLVADWAQRSDSKLMGIDLSGNDLSREEDLDVVQTLLHNPRILELSLRNAKLSRKHAAHVVNAFTPKETSQSSLRKLDLSYNPGLFPHIVDSLALTLRRYPYLSRLQLEHCNLDNDTIVTLCEALSHCHRLVYLSFAGNGVLNEVAATALCVTVHLSQSICTVEADFSESCAALRQQLAKYCLLNLERNAGSVAAEPEPDENADLASFSDDLKGVTKACSESVSDGASIDALVERIEELRTRIKQRMQALLVQRRQGPLSVSAREATLRLFFYNTNLDRLQREVTGLNPVDLQLSEEKVNKMDHAEKRPSFERQASLLSLKKLEREEALSHRKYADQFMNLDDDKMLDAVSNLKVKDLEKIMG